VRVYRIAIAGAATERTASNAATKDGPSLVLLPFATMSGEPTQDFFADRLTQDIITDLWRLRHLFMIWRNSAFKYKGKAVDLR
jgi:adenylate cyclase